MEKIKKDRITRTIDIPDDIWQWLEDKAKENQSSRGGILRKLALEAMKKEKESKQD